MTDRQLVPCGGFLCGRWPAFLVIQIGGKRAKECSTCARARTADRWRREKAG